MMLGARLQGGFLMLCARVGDAVVDSMSNLGAEIATSAQQQLSERLRVASNPDVVETLVAFAGEVQAFRTPEVDLVICLDDLHRVGPEDMQRLARLVDRLRSGNVRIAATFRTSTSTQDEALLGLEAAGADVVRMPGLTDESIEGWLRAVHLSTAFAPQIARLTNGYALDVSACLDLLRADRSLPPDSPDIDLSRVLRVSTDHALRSVSTDARRAIIQLSPYSEPLADEEAASVLGTDLASWGALQVELKNHHIFVGEPPWFHSRRRQILSTVLPEAQVLRARRTAIRSLSDSLAESSAVDVAATRLVELASIVEETSAPSGDEVLDGILSEISLADRPELALLGALIELGELANPVVEVQHVILHAQQVFGVRIEEAVGAVDRLSSRAYVASARNENAHVLGVALGDLSLHYAVGRIAKHLDRMPITGFATQTFNISVRPLIGGFNKVVFGVGAPDARKLAHDARELQIRVGPDQADLAGFSRPNILLRATKRGVPIYAAVAFQDVDVRDGAIAPIRDSGFADPEMLLEIALEHPGERLRSKQFMRALGRALGQRVRDNDSFPGDKHHLSKPLTMRENLEMRLAVRNVIRSRMTDIERFVSDLTDEAPGFLYREWPDGSSLEINVDGFGFVTEMAELQAPSGTLSNRIELMMSVGSPVGSMRRQSRRNPLANPQCWR
jgi:hypothetical protein